MVEIKHIGLILAIMASLFTVTGEILYKYSATIKGEKKLKGRWILFFMGGNIIFIFSILCNFFAMKFIPLFVVYAFTALNYVFVMVATGIILKETIRWNNIFASSMIALGVFLISAKL